MYDTVYISQFLNPFVPKVDQLTCTVCLNRQSCLKRTSRTWKIMAAISIVVFFGVTQAFSLVQNG